MYQQFGSHAAKLERRGGDQGVDNSWCGDNRQMKSGWGVGVSYLLLYILPLKHNQHSLHIGVRLEQR